MKTKLFITGLVLMAATALVNAQPGNGQGCGKCKGNGKGAAYVDNNNNGVCDDYENRQSGAAVKKGNGAGKCNGTGQRQGNGQGKGKNFVDANKNGVCDNYEARTKK